MTFPLVPCSVDFYYEFNKLVAADDIKLQHNEYKFLYRLDLKQRFKSIIRSFTDQEKAKLINYLLKSFHSLIDSSKSRLKPDFFICKKQLAVFFMGVVHYFPELILSQLRSNAKSRIEMMELFKNFILFICSELPFKPELECLFIIPRSDSEFQFKQVFPAFLEHSADVIPKVRASFLQAAHLMLLIKTFGGVHEELSQKVLHFLNDPNDYILQLACEVIENVSCYKPYSQLFQRGTKTIASWCWKNTNMKRRMLVQKIGGEVFLNLAKAYPKDTFDIIGINKIRDALKVRYFRIKGNPDLILEYNLLKEILFKILLL